MKKTCFQLVISTALAVLCGVGFVNLCVYAMGFSESSRETSAYEDMMISAKELFADYADDIQYATALLSEYDDLRIIRCADGTPGVVADGAIVSVREFFGDGGDVGSQAIEGLENLFCDSDEGEPQLYNIAVTESAVQFYTGYDVTGCVGLLYEKEPGSTSFFSTIDLMDTIDEWKVFSNSECGEA
jgi:hypothetical protein